MADQIIPRIDRDPPYNKGEGFYVSEQFDAAIQKALDFVLDRRIAETKAEQPLTEGELTALSDLRYALDSDTWLMTTTVGPEEVVWRPQITPLDNPTASKTLLDLLECVRELADRQPDDDGDVLIAHADMAWLQRCLDAYDGKPPRPVQVWSAGWNVPGYLPDEEPHHFRTWEEAADWLMDELHRADDQCEDSTFEEYMAARQLLKQAEPDQCFHERVGNYLWWVERVTLPAGEEPNW